MTGQRRRRRRTGSGSGSTSDVTVTVVVFFFFFFLVAITSHKLVDPRMDASSSSSSSTTTNGIVNNVDFQKAQHLDKKTIQRRHHHRYLLSSANDDHHQRRRRDDEMDVDDDISNNNNNNNDDDDDEVYDIDDLVEYYDMYVAKQISPHNKTCQAYINNMLHHPVGEGIESNSSNQIDNNDSTTSGNEIRDLYSQCLRLRSSLSEPTECADTTGNRYACCSKISKYVVTFCDQDVLPADDSSSSRNGNHRPNNKTNDEKKTKKTTSYIIGVIIILLVCATTKVIKDDYLKWDWLPDACAYLLVSCFLSIVTGMTSQMVVMMMTTNSEQSSSSSSLSQSITSYLLLDGPSRIDERLHFDEELFSQVLLPPIIFESALNVDKKSFRRDLAPILLFAGIGTLLSSISIGYMVHYGSQQYIPLLDSLVFGALISSIDPVATLGILSGVGVDTTGTLFTMVFGESLLNDGVAIVLFETLRSHLGDEHALEDPDTYRDIVTQFFVVSIGSIATAIVFGIASILFYWSMQQFENDGPRSRTIDNGTENRLSNDNIHRRLIAVAEVTTFFCWAFISYYVAELLGYSGIIAVLTSGFIMDYYILGRTSDKTQEEETTTSSNDTTTEIVTSSNPDGLLTSQHKSNSGQSPLQRRISLKEAFTGRHPGSSLLSTDSCHSVEVITDTLAWTMETIIFAYLGIFIFDDKLYSFILEFTAVMSCIISRGVIVIVLSWSINVAIGLELESRIHHVWLQFLDLLCCCRQLRQRIYDNNSNRPRGSTSVPPPPSSSSHVDPGSLLTSKTQWILFLAGIRGAVSFSLVSKLPVFDVSTGEGTRYRAELKAMTSTTIVFTLFVFGITCYYSVDRPNEEETNHAVDEKDTAAEDERQSLIGSSKSSQSSYGGTV